MARLLLLLAFALAPLAASAHGGHHPGDGEVAAPAAEPTGVVHAVAAPSRCPGGEHENCCCHDATGTPLFHPVAMDARPLERSTPPACKEKISQRAADAPRTVAPGRHSPRGPPTRS